MPQRHKTTALRTYDDPCGIARALDLVGERWALLLVRELLLGPKRFGDLREGLPGVSPNVLSKRLRELVRAGIAKQRTLGAPAGSRVYELSEWGRELEPILLAIGCWGLRSQVKPSVRPPSVDAMMLALKAHFGRDSADVRVRCGLRFDHDELRIGVNGGHLDISRGDVKGCDAVIETDVATLRDLVFSGLSLAEASRSGLVRLEGSRDAAEELLNLFR